MKRIKQLAFLLTIALVSWFTIHTSLILYYGLIDKTTQVELGVVFGTGAISPRLEARITKTLELYKAGWFNQVLITGVKSEADFMYNYLIKNQVPASAIRRDYKGYSTYDSVHNLQAYTNKHGINQVLVISQYFHILRIQLTFKLLGMSPAYHAHADLFELHDTYMMLREFVAYYMYLWKY